MTGLMLLALLVVVVIAWLALLKAPGDQVPAVVTALTRAVVVLVLTYVALRLTGPEDISAVLQGALRYLRM
ncbi:hypothetical protein ACFYTV_33420 [Streptomyces sp. NPDC004562]|uniref:hypothetical protein n=1 Tax=Streptomyces sp. NPDC004562 TaxID=3364703 RepID=UPI00367F7195